MKLLLIGSFAAALALPACKDEPAEEKGEDFLAEPAKPDKPAAPARFEGAGDVLPRNDEVAGWSVREGPAYYDSSTLFEVIDGASAGYLAYGFEAMAKADYASKGIADFTEEIVVEAYRMKTPLAAFGKYSEERASCDPPGKDPLPGCSRGSDRIVHKGKYFVKVTTYDESPAAVRELGRIANAIAKRIPGDVSEPPEVKRFGTEGIKQHSIVYRPKNLLGLSALGAGFQADYQAGEDEYTLFIKSVDAGKAADAFALLERAAGAEGFAKPGSKPAAVAGLGDQALSVETRDGWMVAVRKGDQLVGVVEADSLESATKYAGSMLTP